MEKEINETAKNVTFAFAQLPTLSDSMEAVLQTSTDNIMKESGKLEEYTRRLQALEKVVTECGVAYLDEALLQFTTCAKFGKKMSESERNGKIAVLKAAGVEQSEIDRIISMQGAQSAAQMKLANVWSAYKIHLTESEKTFVSFAELTKDFTKFRNNYVDMSELEKEYRKQLATFENVVGRAALKEEADKIKESVYNGK